MRLFACARCARNTNKLYNRGLCIACIGDEYGRAYRTADPRAREAFEEAERVIRKAGRLYVSDLL